MIKQNAWEAAFDVISLLEENGYEAVIVGGAVRDSLRGHPANDVDVATNAVPEEVKAVFIHTADVGISHGTVLVIHPLSPVEVTTYRTEGTYQDHRRPDEVHFVSSLAEDLKRRDFTINAMAMSGNQEIIDLFGGKEDLQNGVIRAVGEPIERFKEDALRMLRAIRFSAQLGFQIEDSTFEGISKQAKDLHFIAKERIKAEFDKIFVSEHPEKAMQNIKQSGLDEFLPGEYIQIGSWENFEAGMESWKGWAFFCLLQPQQDVKIMHTFKCSNNEKKIVKDIIEAYQSLISQGWTKRHYFEFDLEVLKTAYVFADYLENIPTQPKSVEEIEQNKANLAIQKKTDLVVSGHDLIKWSGKKGGSWLKETLEKILTEILENRLSNDQQHIKEWFLSERDSGI
ncbi:CCA tRNA nucleotidyltransferase [Rummeliibacillus pycnus]|uniref:CCA tRNA nucleotidyltransferase n=1 Tax=Rummeliibacillus pycnus TaxID=101070 RepID=UPI0037CB9DB9